MTTKEKVETREFGAEVSKILDLMINSLYTNKDIFLRELVSNASDACDKLRYLSLSNPELIKDDPDFKITITANEKDKTLTIKDNGIGMNHDELINNIGTIASSGTQKFTEQLTGDKNKDMQLIGQFGVGFYSAFMVADKVEVISKKAGEKKTYKWISEGKGQYSIEEIKDKNFSRGTSITLFLKNELNEYVDKFKIKYIISTYSDHISIPIAFKSNDDKEEEIINSASALWTRNKSEITKEQYNEFYKSVSHQPDEPWLILHNKNEGTIEYTNLLFIPSSKPFDLFHPDRKARVKLYVKKVFIAEDGINVVPAHLRFLRGIIDSQDIPLNISRETLQHNNMINKIQKSVTKRVFSELGKKLQKDRDAYETFWENFGSVIKEGLCEHLDDKNHILDVCLFKSALKDKFITLEEYINDMQEKQKEIFFLSGENFDKIKSSPQLEGFIKNNIDVLIFTDTVDDFWVNVVNEYKGKNFKSVTRSDINLDDIIGKKADDQKDDKEIKDDHQALVNFFKSTLDGKIKDAKISGKLFDSPVCLAVAEGAMDIRMERYLREQKQLASISAKIIEINPKHNIIKKIEQYLKNNQKDEATDIVNILFDEACIIEGEQVLDTDNFAKLLNKLIEKTN